MNSVVYSTATDGERSVCSPHTLAVPYGKNPADIVDYVTGLKIAAGKVEYRKELVRKANRVGMTLDQYCIRFNIKL